MKKLSKGDKKIIIIGVSIIVIILVLGYVNTQMGLKSDPNDSRISREGKWTKNESIGAKELLYLSNMHPLFNWIDCKISIENCSNNLMYNFTASKIYNNGTVIFDKRELKSDIFIIGMDNDNNNEISNNDYITIYGFHMNNPKNMYIIYLKYNPNAGMVDKTIISW